MAKIFEYLSKQGLSVLFGIFNLFVRINSWWSKLNKIQRINVRNNFQKTLIVVIFLIIIGYGRSFYMDYYEGIISRNNNLCDECRAKLDICDKNELERLKTEIRELENVKKKGDSLALSLAITKEQLKNYTKK